MPGDDFKPVRTGDPVVLSARWYNATLGAISATGATRTGAGQGRGNLPPGTVLVKNTSGTDVPRFGVLGLGDVVFSYAANNDGFKNGPAIRGEEPTAGDPGHFGKFAIMLEAVRAGDEGDEENGGIGRGLLLGTTPVQVNVVNETDAFADIADGDVTQLKSLGGGGRCRILWKESGTGTKWAFVEFVDMGGVFPVTLEEPDADGGADGTKTAAATWKYVVKDLNGGVLDGTDTTPIDVSHQRPVGVTLRAGYGLASRVPPAGILQLWWTDEAPDKTGSCS